MDNEELKEESDAIDLRLKELDKEMHEGMSSEEYDDALDTYRYCRLKSHLFRIESKLNLLLGDK